jgi:RNA processing factor Prp31
MKRLISLIIIQLFAFLTNAQGVYDDFIYTRDSATLQNALSNYPESMKFKLNSLTTKIEKLINEGKFNQVEKFLAGQKITLNDAEYFKHQSIEYQSFLIKSKSIECQKVNSDLKNHAKIILFFNYSIMQSDKHILNFRIYFVFHLEEESIKNIDITFVKFPNNTKL